MLRPYQPYLFTTVFNQIFGFQLEGMFLGYAFGYIVGDLIMVVWTKYWLYLRLGSFSFAGMKELVAYSYVLIPNSLAWWIINVSDRTIISWILGATANGIYAIAYKIPNILSSVFNVFSISWQQAATEMVNSEERNRYYNDIYNKMIMVLLSLCCGVLSLNSVLFNYIFDIKYYKAHIYVPILVASVIASTTSQFIGGIQISLKQPRSNGVATVVGSFANVVLHISLINLIGLYAAALSTLISQIIVCVLRVIKLKREIALKFSRKVKKCS